MYSCQAISKDEFCVGVSQIEIINNYIEQGSGDVIFKVIYYIYKTIYYNYNNNRHIIFFSYRKIWDGFIISNNDIRIVFLMVKGFSIINIYELK